MQETRISKTGETTVILEPKDLRIGNLLLYKGQLVHVTMLSMDIDDEYEETIGFCALGQSTCEIAGWNRALCADLNPVYITSELLEKFGFEIHDSNKYFKKGTGEFLVYHHRGFVEYTLNGRIFKYLHEIQNLYFALTGNDLSAKQPPSMPYTPQ